MKASVLSFRTVIEKDGTSYHGHVPSLPGCHTQGKSIEQTRKYLREAIAGYLKTLKEQGLIIPTDESYESVESFDMRSLFENHPSSQSYV